MEGGEMSETKEQMAARLEHVSKLPMFVPEAVAALRAGAQALREQASAPLAPAVEPEPTNIIFDGRLSGTSAVPLAPTPPDDKFFTDEEALEAALQSFDEGDLTPSEILSTLVERMQVTHTRSILRTTEKSFRAGEAHALSSPSPGAVETPTCTECEGRGYIEQGEGLVSTRCDSCAGGSR